MMGELRLRPYQERAIEAVEGEWGAGVSRTLLVQATGTGKTVVMAGLADRAVSRGGRVLVLAHREELLTQARDKFAGFCGLPTELEKAQSHASAEAPVVVASVQTLARESRLMEYLPWEFSHVFVDEAHHTLAQQYRTVLDRFSAAKVLGVTATPDRADKKGLGEVYESIAYEYPLHQAIRDGYLCPIRAELLPLDIDVSQVKVSHGDFQASELGSALDPYLPRIADEMARRCHGHRTLCFLPLVKTAYKMRDALVDAGLVAEVVHGESTDRHELLEAFDAGQIDVLCNSMLLTEGYDSPGVDMIVNLRPTKSRALYTQIVGRGTRLAPGKERLTLLDFLWQSGSHDLCRPASLFAKTKDVADKAARAIEAAGASGMDVDEACEAAERDVAEEREAALAAQLAEQRSKRARLVDPLQFGFSIEDADLAEYEPLTPRDAMSPTEKQLGALEKMGIDPEGVECFGKASLILDRLISRANAGMASPKQIRQLERVGFRHCGTWTKAQASKVMGILASNRWRLPAWFGDPAAYDPSGGEAA